MKLFKICLFLFSIFLIVPIAAAQSSKVGFVNPQRIISESRIGQIAQEDLAHLGKEKDRRVREALHDVEVLKKKLESDTLSVAEQQSLEQSLRLSARSYEQIVEMSNTDIQAEERHLIRFIMHRADSLLQAIAQEGGFTMILTDPEVIGYVDNSMDITDRVIRELNSML